MSGWEAYFPQAFVTVVMGLFTVGVSIQTIFIKWLIDKFDKLGHTITDSTTSTSDWLKEHEEKDQDRHIQNLYRFEKISVALAKLGAENGTK